MSVDGVNAAVSNSNGSPPLPPEDNGGGGNAAVLGGGLGPEDDFDLSSTHDTIDDRGGEGDDVNAHLPPPAVMGGGLGPWPEDDFDPYSLLSRWSFSYMNRIFSKGAEIHRARGLARRSNDVEVADHHQLTHDDLHRTPKSMHVAILRPKFNRWYDQFNNNSSRKVNNSTLHVNTEITSNNNIIWRSSVSTSATTTNSTSPDNSSQRKRRLLRKQTQQQQQQQSTINSKPLMQTLWQIARPTYVYAGFCQLSTVIAQVSVPMFIWQILRILEGNPSTRVFHEAIPYVFLTLLADIVNAYGTHRQRYLAMSAGVSIRMTLVSVIYEHILQLTPHGRRGLSTGYITNLFATDTQKLYEVASEGHLLWSAPLSMILVACMLIIVIGPSMAVGIVLLLLFVPIVQMISKRMMKIRQLRVKVTDTRVEIVTAMIHGIKVTKLNNYEGLYTRRIDQVRDIELALLRREFHVWSLLMAVQFISPVVASAGAFAAYVLLGNNILTTADAFTALLLFNALRFPINYASRLAGKMAQAYDSIQRLSFFMQRETSKSSRDDSEKKDAVMENKLPLSSSLNAMLTIDNGVFITGNSSVEGEQSCEATMSTYGGDCDSGGFFVSGVNISVRPGEVIAIVGPVGCGKSTIINGIIGEIPVSSKTKMTFQGSRIAYSSQVPFILNATLRDNILFGNDFDPDLYDRVLDACCLRADIEHFPAGDMTEIGERGVTLSGGQKQRVSLARVVYSKPDIALFDDPLSALDAGTSRYVFDQLFNKQFPGKQLLSKTAVILVTHSSHYLNQVNRILVVVNGAVPFSGTWTELTEARLENYDQMAKVAMKSILSSVQENGDNGNGHEHNNNESHPSSPIISVLKGEGSSFNEALMSIESREHGLTSSWSWVLWFKYCGGSSFVSIILMLFILEKVFYFFTELWVKFWANATEYPVEILGVLFQPQSAGIRSQRTFIEVYCVLMMLAFVAAFLRTVSIVRGAIRCSKSLYSKMTQRVLHAPMFYFETTPIGRLLNRFTYDAEILDVTLVWSMSMLLISSSWFIAAVVIMVAILPWIFFFLIPICIIYITIHRLYRKSGADLQRLDALSRSPLQTMLVEAIEGSPTIRIFQKEKVFMRRFEDFADKSTMAQMNYIVAQRWLGVRIELLGTSIVFCTILFIITSWGMEFFTLDAGMVALVIRWSGGVTISLSFLCDNAAEAEGAITAIERIQQILLIPQELNFSKTNIDDSWPEKGVVEFRDVKMRYRPKLPLSLNGLSFRVQAGEHCGVVGRTGAGKSSILTALFRLVEIDGGSITIDGVDLSKIGLSDIRGRPNGISIIPQDPILFAGTMRECLDPFGLSTDKKLVDALESVMMLPPGTSTEILDSRIEEGGTNYSVGQRSLLVLARAMLAKPKVLLLDEATASIDGETDKFIQQMLRTRFLGTTLLTIAHRLDTIIDYDKVLVLSNGRAVEFGTPIDLIENNQLFAELINATGEGAASLIEMAQDAKMMRSRRKTTI